MELNCLATPSSSYANVHMVSLLGIPNQGKSEGDPVDFSLITSVKLAPYFFDMYVLQKYGTYCTFSFLRPMRVRVCVDWELTTSRRARERMSFCLSEAKRNRSLGESRFFLILGVGSAGQWAGAGGPFPPFFLVLLHALIFLTPSRRVRAKGRRFACPGFGY